jgi:hypothetical protein
MSYWNQAIWSPDWQIAIIIIIGSAKIANFQKLAPFKHELAESCDHFNFVPSFVAEFHAWSDTANAIKISSQAGENQMLS